MVRSLAIEGRWVVHVPEGVQELVIGDLGRVVGHLHRFGVAGPAAADLLVRRVVASATGVPGDGIDDAGHLVEKVLDTPEAAACEGSFFHLIPSIRRTYDCPSCARWLCPHSAATTNVMPPLHLSRPRRRPQSRPSDIHRSAGALASDGKG